MPNDPAIWIMVAASLGWVFLVQFGTTDGHRRKVKLVPSSKNAQLKIKTTALDADGDRWLWETYFVDFSSENYGASGVVNDEGKAWERAREAADDARARYAAEQMRQSKGRVETLPL